MDVAGSPSRIPLDPHGYARTSVPPNVSLMRQLPRDKGYLLFAKNLDGKRKAWMELVPIRIRAMLIAGNRLAVAGPPDLLDPQDPLAAFEGRKGGLFRLIDTGSGETVVERELPSPTAFNGIAAAGGKLIVVEENGSVSCFGRPR